MKNCPQTFLGIFVLCVFLLGGCAQNAAFSLGNLSEQKPAGSAMDDGISESGPAEGGKAEIDTTEGGSAESSTSEYGTAENDANRNSTVQDSTAENTPAPQIEFECIDLDGNTVTNEIFSGSRLTMVNVWATYCDPCLREMPGLGELAAEYDPAEFQIIGIVSDVLEGDDQSLAESLVQQTGATYPHLLLNRSIYTALLTDVTAVPTTFFINENGEILGSVLGSMQKSAWEEMINALLES